ncbi:REC14 [Mytilus edulis]|uniref:WDR61 n=1 Tax=Mytilus edulis TaxID=6550 RepID=A0A8S3S0E9_MYTED|nr:REC14 [Mytilus edulis]
METVFGVVLNIFCYFIAHGDTHEDSIWSCAWKKNETDGSENIITGGIDDLVKIWRWTDGRLDLRHALEGHQLGVVSVDINKTELAASSSLDSHVRVWDIITGKCIKSIDAGPVDAWTLAFSPDSKFLATGSHSGKINIFGVDSGRKEMTMDTRGKFTLSIAYSPNGQYIACGSIDGIVNVFDVNKGVPINTLEDSQLLLTGSDDNTIKVYEIQHAIMAGALSGHGSWVLSVDFCKDDTHFVSSSSDKTVKIWDAGSRQCVHTFYDHADQVWSAKYSDDGSKIVSVSDDKSIQVYEGPPV